MNKALINIDYTYDFVADDGKLTAGKAAQEIEAAVHRVTQNFYEAGEFVCFAIDTHHEGDRYHPETALFPPHNIEGSSGSRLFGTLADYYQKIKESENIYYMPKTRYSAFAGTDLDIKLRERKITELHLIGVCSDICVLHTAIDAYNRGYAIVIHQDAVATFVSGGQQWALQHFKNCLGARIVG